MNKYTNYFKAMMMTSVAFVAISIAAAYDHEGTICAITTTVAFISWFVGAMSPDSEKYTPNYLRKHKGWR